MVLYNKVTNIVCLVIVAVSVIFFDRQTLYKGHYREYFFLNQFEFQAGLGFIWPGGGLKEKLSAEVIINN